MYLIAIKKLSKMSLAVSLFVLTMLLAVAIAFAHAVPVQMSPAANSTVSAPASVIVHFSEALEPKFSTLTLTDAGNQTVSKEPSVVSKDDAKVMTLPLPALEAGIYTVKWVSVAVDGHREQGNYKFTVK